MLIGGSSSNVNDWNTFFDLPTYGTGFTSVSIVGNIVNLIGGSNINLKAILFYNNSNLLEVNDNNNCIITASASAFNSCNNITTISFPVLTTIGDQCFIGCNSLVNLSLPSLITAGASSIRACSSLVHLSFPSLTTLGNSALIYSTALTTINLSSCTNLGTTVGDNSIFFGITSNTITLTIPSALMTCNDGVTTFDPDGDIQYLDANNTLTIIQV